MVVISVLLVNWSDLQLLIRICILQVQMNLGIILGTVVEVRTAGGRQAPLCRNDTMHVYHHYNQFDDQFVQSWRRQKNFCQTYTPVLLCVHRNVLLVNFCWLSWSSTISQIAGICTVHVLTVMVIQPSCAVFYFDCKSYSPSPSTEVVCGDMQCLTLCQFSVILHQHDLDWSTDHGSFPKNIFRWGQFSRNIYQWGEVTRANEIESEASEWRLQCRRQTLTILHAPVLILNL